VCLINMPPAKAANPSTRIASSNATVTCETVQPYVRFSGMRKTLHAYTAPSAICMSTPATARIDRLGVSVFISFLQVHRARHLPRYLASKLKG
jgi:hypothetical protein